VADLAVDAIASGVGEGLPPVRDLFNKRALHEHDRRLVGFRADAIVIKFEKRCREVRVSKNFG